jgi:large subunit ribosomal protein L33
VDICLTFLCADGSGAILACQLKRSLLQYAAVHRLDQLGRRPRDDISEELFPMASKKGNRIVIKLRSTESGHTYTTMKNRKNDPTRLELRRYDPTLRRHVAYRETK